MAGDPSVFQDSFNAAVEENMEIFEMSEKEARKEAIEQLQAQGVDLRLVVTDGRAVELPARVAELQCLVESPTDVQPLLHALQWLRHFCAAGLAHRCLAGRQGVYPLLEGLLESTVEDRQLTAAVLDTLTALQTGQPDLLDARGTLAALRLLDAHPLSTLAWLSAVTVQHERNRRQLVDAGLLQLLTDRLQQAQQLDDVQLTAALCRTAANFTLDDDVRTEFGNAPSNARALVQLGALTALKHALSVGVSDAVLSEAILMLCSKLCVCIDYCETLASDGGLLKIITALRTHATDTGVCRRSLALLSTLAGSDKIKDEIISLGAAPIIVDTIEALKRSAPVCTAGLRAVSFLALRSPQNSSALAESGVPAVVARVMKLHTHQLNVQMLACMAVRNLVSRSLHLQQQFLVEDMENLIHTALSTHAGKMEFEARAALRDLGCTVHLREEWTGHGGALTTGLIREAERLAVSE